MKNIIIAALLVATVLLGAVGWQQKKQLAQMQTQLADAQNQLQEKSGADEKIAFTEKKAKALQEALIDTSKFAAEKSKLAEQLQQAQAAAKTSNVSPFANLFKDPKMKEMVKSSQKLFMGPMMDKQYAALFQQLNLTPEQAATLKDLLQKKMFAGTDAKMSMMDGSLDAAQRAELSKQIKSETDDADAQIKQFLGDENYQAFQVYEKTKTDRMTVSQFSDQLAGGTTPLSPDQQEQLIQAMSEERNGFKWTTDFSNRDPASGDFTAIFTDDKINQFAQENEKLDEQILARVQPILTPEQITSFQQFQTSHRSLQMAGMKMAAQMFAPKSQ